MTKILIIEDTVQLRESVADALELEGYEVIQAGNGEIGIRLAMEHMPDLILCDIVMPEMDGYDVLQSLKAKDGQVPFPFIYITALAERHNFRVGMELGADDYLIKPFTIYELLKAINIRINKHQSIERRINSEIEKIENELSIEISKLKEQIDLQKNVIQEIADSNTQITGQLNEKQVQLIKEAFRTIEINNTLQFMAKQISSELQKDGIPEDQRTILVSLRNRIRNKSVLLNNWTIFQIKFNQSYPKFTTNLLSKFPLLTKVDLVFISAIFINLNTQQLSVIMNITPESVRKNKYRLKKKLGLNKDDDFKLFIHQMSLNEE
jgi:DNA-binding response OmpR family regulator